MWTQYDSKSGGHRLMEPPTFKGDVMTQLILFPIELVDPDDVVSEETRLARMTAYDAYHAVYLRHFWNARRAVIAAQRRLRRA